MWKRENEPAPPPSPATAPPVPARSDRSDRSDRPDLEPPARVTESTSRAVIVQNITACV